MARQGMFLTRYSYNPTDTTEYGAIVRKNNSTNQGTAGQFSSVLECTYCTDYWAVARAASPCL